MLHTLGIDNKEVNCQHKDWNELMEDGWKFIGMKENHVLMTRKGYINEFWESK